MLAFGTDIQPCALHITICAADVLLKFIASASLRSGELSAACTDAVSFSFAPLQVHCGGVCVRMHLTVP